ncbi:MAG TPA: hypothetical protein VHW09_15225 [Bryobacteraceae bacterium]|jgi:hypothetical protein|nr:hypothetical protein [Bryobacteraceae bacterium]
MGRPRSTELVLPRLDANGNGNGVPLHEPERESVRTQLESILASSVFRNSRRYSSLLRYVVEETLDGKAEFLKERTIGVDVFGRASDYDTNTDHVVRSVAGDVRRRLAQYYMENGRDAELRIDMQLGSYIPQFRFPERRFASGPAIDAPETPQFEAAPVISGRPKRRWYWLAIAVMAAAVLLSIGMVRLAGPRTALQRFWYPVFSSSSPVLISFGGGGSAPAPANDVSVGEYEHLPFRRMNVSDALALADLTGLLQSGEKPYRIVNRAGATSFKDLQSGPFVLIGAMNNEWTLRLTSGERFSFERIPNGARIVDRQNPSNNAWSVDRTTPISQFNRDYAIVSRVRDPRSEQTAVIIAGIGSWGTLAAGEFVAKEEHLRKLDALAPAHWERKNVQVVISTDVIHASSGPPKVLAVYFW